MHKQYSSHKGMKRVFALSTIANSLLAPACYSAAENRPNILFVISDDQSYPHASAYGSTFIKTPGFDFVAHNGWLFNNAFVTSPGSSPSRASILTGLYPWQIEEAGTHASSFPLKYECLPDILAQNGYHVGYTGKGWGPGNWKISGREQNPAGPAYNHHKTKPPYKGISNISYVDNFNEFIDKKEKGQPFYFWLGANEPHRPYESGSWKKENKLVADVAIPPFLPDKKIVRSDLLDYATEIEWYDNQLMQIIQILKQRGELDNTLIIVTADNGMPFPAAKATCFEYGIHVPLAICWIQSIKQGKISNELVSSIDLFPTILDAVGINPPKECEGNSLLPYLKGKKENTGRDIVCAGRERHSSARHNNWGYPVRSIRTEGLLYIRNFQPERWPAGDPYFITDKGEHSPMHEAYFDIDKGPAWNFMISNRDSIDIFPYFLHATAKRPYEELYDIKTDPGCFHNLIGNSKYEKEACLLRKKMDTLLKKTKDTRFLNPENNIWDDYPRLDGPIRTFPSPQP